MNLLHVCKQLRWRSVVKKNYLITHFVSPSSQMFSCCKRYSKHLSPAEQQKIHSVLHHHPPVLLLVFTARLRVQLPPDDLRYNFTLQINTNALTRFHCLALKGDYSVSVAASCVVR